MDLKRNRETVILWGARQQLHRGRKHRTLTQATTVSRFLPTVNVGFL